MVQLGMRGFQGGRVVLYSYSQYVFFIFDQGINKSSHGLILQSSWLGLSNSVKENLLQAHKQGTRYLPFKDSCDSLCHFPFIKVNIRP
jgi:hypothetical protein